MVEPLSDNPVFRNVAAGFPGEAPDAAPSVSPWRIPLNLVAYDGCGRLFVWNSCDRLLHSVDIEQLDIPVPQETLLAKAHFRTLWPSLEVDFQVRFITFNRRGWFLILAGDNALVVLDLTSQASAPLLEASTYSIRATIVGADKFHSLNKALRIVHVAWHPYSDTHIGVLSSDGVFRLFDISTNAESPEQEYHIQSQLIDKSTPATYARPVAFAFGGEHLWDRFAVFMLFSNGSVYVLCPVCPFKSFYNSSAIEELYRDACQWASSNASVKATNNASLAAAWLESVFPSLVSQAGLPNSLVLKAFPHVPFNSSLLLQGPLPVIMGVDLSASKNSSCKFSSLASMLMYSAVGKDSILAISSKDGQMQLYALADELQPMWNENVPPRLQIGEEGHLVSVGMLVETHGDLRSTDPLFSKDDESDDGNILEKRDGIWTNQIPPLLQLAVIDFALPGSVLESAPLSILADAAVPERLYCHHAAGIDAVLLQWLPFSEHSIDKVSSGKPPIVYPILDTCPSEKSVHLPLLGVTQLLDSFGNVWLVAVTASGECVVIRMKPQEALDPLRISESKSISQESENTVGVVQVISKELLQGPKDIPIPLVSSSGRALTLETIEGRAFLHDHCKLLHEKYIEYAHRVYVELTSHGSRLHEVVEDLRGRLSDVESKVSEAHELSESLKGRINAAFQRNQLMKDRLKRYGSLLTVRRKPLTVAEQEYKSQLDVMRLHDLDILHNAVDVLKERFERQAHVSKAINEKRWTPVREKPIPSVQMNRLKAAVSQLTQMVENSLKQVKTLDELIEKREALM